MNWWVNVSTALNYIEHFLILAFTITGYVYISAFAFLFGILTGITSSAIGLKVCTLTAGIKKVNNEKKGLLAKSKLNRIEVLISKSLVDSVIRHDEFVFLSNVLKEYNKMKEATQKFMKDFSHIVWSAEKTQNVKIRKFQRQKKQKQKRKNNPFIKICSVW